MKPTTKWITGSLVVAGIIYALSPGPGHLIDNPDGWELREQFVFLTGLSALSLMVLSMIISVRNPWVNRRMKGLDKAYVIHKWTGIFATILMVFHWLGEKVPHLLVDYGLIPDPGELTDGSSFSDLEIGLFQSGVILVEWTFYIVLILVIIALFKKIPYSIFRKTHRIFPVVFLLAAYHGATAQLKERWLTTPGGYLLLLLAAIGTAAACISLFQKIGASRKINTVITQLENRQNGILDLRLSTNHKPFIHQPGQYAFLRFEHDTEPHPFTIASSGKDPQSIRFAIKSFGDFTSKLTKHLQAGQNVQIEGPYGEFIFRSSAKRQIWIAGGIGITPFLAKLEQLASQKESLQTVDFWYSTRTDKQTMFPDSLKDLCKQSGVRFYHLNSGKKEYLTAQMLHEVVGSFAQVSIWFCGPEDFANCILKGLAAYDFDQREFHYDNFSMR
ncbi:ferric reductase-like transmembrane domain-containing protein [Dyadobacter subterraneus]|uniref:Ferric reductase-like transmembrane domain-containing protein n=1 Tax=Dyadobacter subterraneus TaxID=2773304 RepID=A0ABR9WDJ2_9BACT|nr:ferric reductase-like transmembrane domain-containing protein [Dyadobacter subterraneus]MBE9463545.1 ferric reductase-like transmembrane domain-containing protein [Dyadobacter subterraneus]